MKKSLKIVPFLIVLAAVGCERSGRAPKVAAADDKTKTMPTVTTDLKPTPVTPVRTGGSKSLPIASIAADSFEKNPDAGKAGSIHCESETDKIWANVSFDIEPAQGTLSFVNGEKKTVEFEVAKITSRDLNEGQDFYLPLTRTAVTKEKDGLDGTLLDLSSGMGPGRDLSNQTMMRLQMAKDGTLVNRADGNSEMTNVLVITSAGETEMLSLKCESKLAN